MSEIQFCETDTKTIENNIIEGYEKLTNKKLYPADPIRIFLQGLAYIIVQQRVVINETGKQNLLKYANGVNLDAIGALTGTLRIPKSPAYVDIKFTRVKGSAGAILIRTGTRVTADSNIYFVVQKDSTLKADANNVIVKCKSLTDGTLGNNYEVGAINKLVDPISYIASVSNTEAPSGGADTESDDNYRDRIYIAPERFSVAGPILAYEYFTKSAHVDINDVAVISNEPGVVEIYPLLKGGELPSSEILDLVKSMVTDEKVRPLTDNVSVLAPVKAPAEALKVEFIYYLYKNSNVTNEQIKAAVDSYVEWQKGALGRDINPDILKANLINTGVKRVDIVSPVFTALQKFEAANIGEIIINFGGLE